MAELVEKRDRDSHEEKKEQALREWRAGVHEALKSGSEIRERIHTLNNR
jgi:hypothetical protein